MTQAAALVDVKQWDEEIGRTDSRFRLSHLRELEAESIHIIREVFSEFQNPVMLYSVGKDSSVMIRLAQKAFYPGKVPFPLLHIDTSFKFPEMYRFRERIASSENLNVLVHSNQKALAAGANPFDLGVATCCGLLKTRGLLDGLASAGYDAAFGGARRDEEKSRAKERIYSFRDSHGQWDPKRQRPEIWNLFNGRIKRGETIRVFPLSNWTELDIWHYIYLESIPVVSLYFAKEREVVEINGQLVLPDVHPFPHLLRGERQKVWCRFRSLGCIPCTGAIRSRAQTLPDIIAEMSETRTSERAARLIDHDSDDAMEQKKREGYF